MTLAGDSPSLAVPGPFHTLLCLATVCHCIYLLAPLTAKSRLLEQRLRDCACCDITFLCLCSGEP